MKKFLLAFYALLAAVTANAQLNAFNHLAVNLGVGSTGVSLEAATPITNFLALRAGVNYVPKFTASTSLNIESEATAMANSYAQLTGKQIPSDVDVEGKLNMTTGRVILDFYPIPSRGLFICAGVYFGSTDVITAKNKVDGILSDVVDWNNQNPTQKLGVTLGDYFLTPDSKGNVNADIEVAKVRPYVGLGWGRSVPNHRLGFQLELGCQFWNTPKVYCNGTQLEKDKVGSDDGGVIKLISKVSAYPTLTFRLCGKIF